MAPQNSSFEIRNAGIQDAAAIAALLHELGFPASTDDVSIRIGNLLGAGETVLVAVRDGAPVGLVTAHITPVIHRPTPVGRLTVVVIAERARGQGVGRALVEAAERLLEARGCALVEVTSNRSLADAHAFYERLGYEPTSFRFHKSLTSAQKG